MNRSVLASSIMLSLSVAITAPQVYADYNDDDECEYDDCDDDDDDGLSKEAVVNPNAPDFSAIFNWGVKIRDIDELFLIAGHGAHDANGTIHFPDDPVAQTKYILDGFDTYLGENGYDRDDIIRIEFTMTNEVDEAEFGAILGLFAGYFADVEVRPAAGTLRIVDALAIPGMLVEYEIWCAK